MVTAVNSGNETKITRRIIAEENDWTLQVFTLADFNRNNQTIIRQFLTCEQWH